MDSKMFEGYVRLFQDITTGEGHKTYSEVIEESKAAGKKYPGKRSDRNAFTWFLIGARVCGSMVVQSVMPDAFPKK